MARTSRFLPDKFDDVASDPRYIGTHRRAQSSLSVFAPIGIGLGLVVVLVLGGLWWIDRSNNSLELDDSAILVPAEDAPAGDSPPAEEGIDSGDAAGPAPANPGDVDLTTLTITVLNGTGTQGLAARAGSRLIEAGWPEPTATNADSSDVAQSLIAYGNAEDLAIALGIANVLGISSEAVIQSDTYPGARVTVILGSDYVDTEAT